MGWLKKSEMDCRALTNEREKDGGLQAQFESVEKELHMCFNEKDFPLFLLAKRIKLQHLNKALTGFLDDTDLKLEGEHLHTDIEIGKDVVDESGDFTFHGLHHFVEASK